MKINKQPAESPADSLNSLDVHSIFYTLQGEGPFTGHPAVFIRMAGCNLQCPKCDTEYTTRTNHTPTEILKAVEQCPPRDQSWSSLGRLAVITGGEPLRQNIRQLVFNLLEAGYRVQVETNGTLYQDLPWKEITVICSPKSPRIHPRLQPFITAYKYVLDSRKVDPSDGLPTRALGGTESLARPPWDFSGPIYLQPMDEHDPVKNDKHVAATKNSCLKFGYIMGLQLHKYLGLQ